MIHSGWPKKSTLAWNFASALTFLAGAVLAYDLSGSVEVGYLLPFAAGNFIYIAAADLIPDPKSMTGSRSRS